MTDLSTFLKRTVKPAPASAEPSPNVSPILDAATLLPAITRTAAQADEVTESHNTEPRNEATVYRDTTPAGIVVEYCPDPRWYKVNGIEVASVTTILDVLAKDGLKWWGQGVGLAGVVELFTKGLVSTRLDWSSHDDVQILTVAEYVKKGKLWEQTGRVIDATQEALSTALTANKLTVNHTLDKAATRGTNVHDALEQWAKSGGEFFPTPAGFTEEEQPYVKGLLSFIDTLGGAGRPVLCEVMVGSAEHGFAGRYDLVIELTEPVEFIQRHYKRKEHKKVTVEPGRYLCDLKTSKSVYETHALQLAAYELASLECGYPATDGRFVIHITDGVYQFVPTFATANQFLAVKAAHDAMKELKV